MTDLSEFSETYAEARAKFLAAASDAGATTTFYQHDGQVGPNGEPLFLDVVRIGPAHAAKILVVGSGTHGIEGFPGSAVQIRWLKRFDPRSLPDDTSIVFTHAHNPWGFANALRCTEENVDLNRNFIDFGKPLPANPNYHRVQEIISRPAWVEDDLPAIFAELTALREAIGEQAFSDAFNGGQYSHADGIFYGGAREQWSNRAFRRAISDHVTGAKAAAIIDLHTGIGPRDGHIFLCFHPENSPAYQRARIWWGERAVNREGVTHKAVAKYQGLLVDAFNESLAGIETTAIVVEFGTVPREQGQRASMAARSLWTSRSADAALRARLMHYIREAYYPSAPEWRAGVLRQSGEIIGAALTGLAHSPNPTL